MNYVYNEIGGTDVEISLGKQSGYVLILDKYSVSFDNYETPILETVLKSIDVFIDENNIHDISGICVSATGQIDVNKGTVIGKGGNIKNNI